MSGLFGVPFQVLQSPNLPACASKAGAKQPSKKIVKKVPSSSTHEVLNADAPVTSSLATSNAGQVPQPQPQDLDGATLAPAFSKQEIPLEIQSVLKQETNLSIAAAPIASSGATALAVTPITTPSHASPVVEATFELPAQVQDERQGDQARLFISPLQPDGTNDDENRNYSPVMDQLDETMILLQSMQVQARAANDVRTPRPLSLSAAQDKGRISSPPLSLSTHASQKEAWLAGYSSGLAHAHAQALCHIEELGNIQTHVTATSDSVDELREKYENLASQLSFLQGTCTQAFTGIWSALGRNTSMIEERLQVEAALLSRITSLDARVVAHGAELQQQTQAITAIHMSQHGWWRRLQHLIPRQLPPHLLLQVLAAASAVEILLRCSSVVLGSRLRPGRKLLRRVNALVAVASFLPLLLRAWHAAFPALSNLLALLRTVSRPFAALSAAAEKVKDVIAELGSD